VIRDVYQALAQARTGENASTRWCSMSSIASPSARSSIARLRQAEEVELPGGGLSAGWRTVLASHRWFPDSGCRSSSLHRNPRHSQIGHRPVCRPTLAPDIPSGPEGPRNQPRVKPQAALTSKWPGRTSRPAAQAIGRPHCRPNCSAGRRLRPCLLPHELGLLDRARGATDRGPRSSILWALSCRVVQ
jgi:hypothetical protein